MLRRFALPLILLLITSAIFAQNPTKEQNDDVALEFDSPAHYPGGLPSLYAYLQSRIEYPADARRSGVEGKTFIQFVVDSSGYIIPNSVKAIKTLYPSCDAEAVRVIKSCKTQWKPALKNGKGVNQQFVLPVAFSLTPAPFPRDPLHPIELPIKTIVINKTFKSQDTTAWALYSDSQTRNKAGRVLIGDSVVVTGWAPWAYYVQTDSMSGYISWKAVEVTEDLKRLSKIVAEQSGSEYKPEEYKKVVAVDPRSRFAKPNAHVSVTALRNNIYAGECVTLTLAFNVHPENRARLQFYDLGQQLANIMTTGLTPDNCYISNLGIVEVAGENKVIAGVNYTTYPIYKASYCPLKPGTLIIPAVALRMAKVQAGPNGTDSLLTFVSKPLSIKVNDLPEGIAPSTLEGYPLVGRFELIDSLPSNISTGTPVSYKVTIRGGGLTFPLDAPEINVANVSSELLDIVDSHSSIADQLQSSKTFTYQLIFEKPSVYDLSGKIAFRYFNPATRKVVTITSRSKVSVSDGVTSKGIKRVSPFGSKNNFIAIDASQSMMIEDYSPNRLGAVKNGLKEFLMSRHDCTIGLILFGGDAKHLKLADADKCYSRRFIDSIDFNFNTNGTAIGNAIWLAKNSFAKNSLPKKLVIIGDGDNTAGHIPPRLAATLVKKYNITIYTIGVGTPGLVPFGKDETGKPFMIENTFTDRDFKTISSITNGRYYWAKDEQDVQRILKTIFE